MSPQDDDGYKNRCKGRVHREIYTKVIVDWAIICSYVCDVVSHLPGEIVITLIDTT